MLLPAIKPIKNHTANFTDYKLLGNVDVASAIDEARQREIDRHKGSFASLLRWLAKQPSFYENVVTRFKGINQKRFE